METDFHKAGIKWGQNYKIVYDYWVDICIKVDGRDNKQHLHK